MPLILKRHLPFVYSYISICTYLPLSYMEKVIDMDFEDEEIEEPIRFNPDLQLW